MKILNKKIVGAYADAIIELITKGNCTVETTKNIKETLFALKEEWCDETADKYAQIGVLLDAAYAISTKYCIENKVLDYGCDEFFQVMLDLWHTSANITIKD